MTSTYFHMTDSTGSSGFLPTVTFDCSNDGVFTSSRRTSQLAALGIDGFYEADFTNIVTTIDVSAFAFDASLVVATINRVTTISNDAFYGCTSLRSITLDTAVDGNKRYLLTSIGNSALYGCTSLRNLHIPDTITRIPDYLCYGCTGLEVAVMGYGLDRTGDTYNRNATIGEYAFANCSRLSYFVIPETVKNVYDFAFNNDPSLSYVAFLGRPDVSANVFQGTTMNSATAIYTYDMSKNNLTSFATDISAAIPGSATRRIYREFTISANSGTSVDFYNFPAAITTAFPAYTSTSWWKAKIASGVTKIEVASFRAYELVARYPFMIGMSFPSSLTTIGFEAFSNNTNTSFPATNFGAFYFPNSLTTFDLWSGQGNRSGAFDLYNDTARANSTTKQFVFQSGASTVALRDSTFQFNSARAIIASNLTSFGANCFNTAKNLQLVNFFQKNAYSTFTALPNGAFQNTFIAANVGPGTHYIYIPKQVSSMTNIFNGTTATMLFTVYDKTADGTAGNNTEGLGTNTANNASYLTTAGLGTITSATIHLICNWYDATGTLQGGMKGYGYPYHVLFHPSITTITNRFFDLANTNSLIKSMAIHHSGTPTVVLNNSAFDLCTQLAYAYLNRRVKTIGINAFRNARLSTAFDLSDAAPLEGIYWAAFYTDTNYTSNLRQITIPNTVKAIGAYAFGCGAANGKPSFNSLSFATDISFWGDYDAILNASTTTTAFGWSNTNHAGYMAIPAYFCINCNQLRNISFFDTVDAIGNAIPTYSTGLMEYPDLNSPMPTRLNKQILTNKIKRIGQHAFRACVRLQSVRVPDGVTSIDKFSFFDLYSCSYFYLPDSFTTFNSAPAGEEPFNWMHYANQYDSTNPNNAKPCIRFPSAFLNSIRTTTLTSTSFGVWTGSSNPYYITVDVSSTYGAISNGIFGRFMNNNVTYFYFNVILPNNVHSLLPGATLTTSSFGSLNISSVTLPSTLRYIPLTSFESCTFLKNVFIPTTSNLTTIEPYAFKSCTALTSFFIPNSLHRISQEMFNGCTSMASITYGDNPGIISIDHAAFYNTTRTLTSIFIPASVVNIGRFAFIGNAASGGHADPNILNTVTIGAGSRLKAIGGFAFGNSGNDISNSATYLQNLVLPSTLRYMGGNNHDNGRIFQNAFRNKHTDNFIFPSSVTFLPFACFFADGSTTDISNVYVPMSITATAGPRIHNGYRDNTNNRVAGIGGYVFGNSRAGSLIYLPSHLSGVTSPADDGGYRPAYNFPDATRVRSYYRPVSYSTNPLTSLNLLSTLGTTTSETATNQIHAAISEGVTIIGDGTNSITTGGNAANLISVNIPSSVTTIRNHAFKGSYALVYVTFSENSHLTSIGTSSFQDCSMIHDIRLPDTLTSIGQNAFYGCSNLTSISIPYNVTSLGSGAFSNNPNTAARFTPLGQTIVGEATGDNSGRSVSLSADGLTVAIGAAANDGTSGTDRGHCRVYRYNTRSCSWTQIGQDIDGEAAADNSGYSVSLSADGTIVAVGANVNSNANGATSGQIRVHKYNSVTNTWTQIGQDIDGEFGHATVFGDRFGWSVSLSADGTIVAGGATNNDGTIGPGQDNRGHCRVFQYNSVTNTWTQLGLDIDGAVAGDQSGYAVALSGNGTTVAIGAYFNDATGTSSGHCRIFKYISGTWTQLGADINGEAAGDRAGNAVAINSDGTIVAVGAFLNASSRGHCRVFQYNSGTNTWTKLGLDIDGEGALDQSGFSVSLSSDGFTLAIGAILNDGNGADSGHCRLYKYISGTWTQLAIDIDGGAAGDQFGNSVSLSSDGTIVAVGGINNDANGNDSGHCRIYTLNTIKSLQSVQIHQRLYNDISGSLSSYFTTPSTINFQIIPSLMLTNTLNPSKLTISQINNLYIRQRQSQLGFCTKITVNASNGDGILRASDITTALTGTTGFVHLDISTNVTSIDGEVCLNNTRIYSVAIPKTVVTFGTSVFNGCLNLSYLSFHPDSVCTTIGDSAFLNTNIIDLTLPDSLTTILGNAFRNSKTLTSVCIPKSVTSLGNYAFLDCPKLTSVILPTSLPLVTYGTGTYYFSTTSNISTGISFTSYPTTSDIPHFKLTDFSLPSGIVQSVVDSSVNYIDHLAYHYYPDLTLYSVSSRFNQVVTSGPFSYQINKMEMPAQPAALLINATTINNSARYPIYRSIPDLNVYSYVSGAVTVAMDNLDDFWVLYPGYSMVVYSNLYDEENISVFDVSLANVTSTINGSEVSSYFDNQYGTTPLYVNTTDNIASSVLIMYNGKILSKVYIS